MTKTEKNSLIADLSSEFKSANGIVVCDYKGLTCKELESLRALAKESNAKVQVIKNTLAGIAIKNCDYEALELAGSSLFIWSEDQLVACKIADKFAAEKKDKFVIKSGVLEGKASDAKTVIAMAKLPGREELIGMLLSVWTAPARNFVTGLDNLKKKLEEAA